MFCARCGAQHPDEHRYCFACGHPLPGDAVPLRRPKATMLFVGIPTHASDPPEPVLRVSRYLEDVEFEAAEGSVVVPGHHVRLSMWVGDTAVCAMRLPESEAERLARFLLAAVEAEAPAERAPLA